MKTIKTFIQQDVLLPRVTQAEVLVVYDPERRYRDLCMELTGEQLRVIDAGGSITRFCRSGCEHSVFFDAPHPFRPPLQGYYCWGRLPRALPWAMISRPFGAEIKP